MKRRTSVNSTPIATRAAKAFALIGLLLGLVGQQAFATDTGLVKSLKSSIAIMEYDNSLKVRGFKASSNVYVGQSKVAGQYGVGFVVEQKSFAWGLNNRGISIVKRF